MRVEVNDQKKLTVLVLEKLSQLWIAVDTGFVRQLPSGQSCLFNSNIAAALRQENQSCAWTDGKFAS